ncbi:MAG: dephospho-CoA kinase [Treponema sp.]|nr:dephospho-CoA kinase [Treponema sp.]
MILCVTGPMAAGKNLAAEILGEKGFVGLDADTVAHDAVEECRDSILNEFSAEANKRKIQLEGQDKKIDRRALASIVFSDPSLLKRQEDIVYPYITRKIEGFIESNREKDKVLHATVLYKIPELLKKMDAVLYIDSPVIIRFLRARKRDGLSAANIIRRFRNQRNLFANYKALNADTVRVWNIGSRKSLEKKIKKFLSKGRPGIKEWNKKEHCGF